MMVLPSYEGGRVERLAFTPEGEWLVSVASHPLRRERSAPVRLWNCFDGRQYYRQPVPTHYGMCRALSTNGDLSAWIAHTTRGNGICIWDAFESRERLFVPAPHSAIGFVAFDTNDEIVLFRNDVSRLGLFSLERRELIATERWPDAFQIPRIEFVPGTNVKRLAASIRKLVTLMEAESKRRPSAEGYFEQLVFSFDGAWIAGMRSESIQVWDAASLTEKWFHKQETARLQSISFSRDQHTLAGTFDNGTVVLWNTADGRVRQSYQWNIGSLGAIAFAPDGLTCAVGGEEGRIVIWDLDD
jgi:WD40 repeat protein